MSVIDQLNRIEISGSLAERNAVRFTPAGVSVVECSINHCSKQLEAESAREIVCSVQCIAIGELAKWLDSAPLGVSLKLTGFLAQKSRNSKQLIVHITTIEFAEGNQNG